LSILIDGYNVLFAIAHHAGQSVAEALDEAQRRLLSELTVYARQTGEAITVIFDSTRSTGGASHEERHGRVRVRYTHPPRTADDDIRRLVEVSPKPQSLLVVSSDRELGTDCRNRGARVVGSMSFYRDLTRHTEASRDDEEEMLLKTQPPTAAEVREWLKEFGEG
jgi:predicted RNA-binding protein with PIN domain